jgi:hypothetical protein
VLTGACAGHLLGSAPPMSEPLDLAEPAAPPGSTMGTLPPDPRALGPVAAPTPRWRQALPFVVAAVLIAATLSRIDFHAFVRHLAAVNAPLYLLSADAFATALVYRRTVVPVTFREFWVLRGVSYLPSILNHHVGQAFLTYYVARAHGVPLARMAGGTLLVYVSWMGLLLGACCLAMVFAGLPLLWPALVFGSGLVYLAVIALRPGPLSRVKLLAPLFEAGLAGHMVALAVRLPHFVVLFLGTWLPFFFFGVNIPLRAAMTYMPILMVIVTLPIAPQGMGARDIVAAQWFERFATGATHQERLAALAAATTSWVVAFTLAEALIGIVLWRAAMPAIQARAKVAVTPTRAAPVQPDPGPPASGAIG